MRRQNGFSLIELLVVVAIVGVLASAGVVGYQNYTKTAKENVAKNNYASVVRYIRNEAQIAKTGLGFGGETHAEIMDRLIVKFGNDGFNNPYTGEDAAVRGFYIVNQFTGEEYAVTEQQVDSGYLESTRCTSDSNTGEIHIQPYRAVSYTSGWGTPGDTLGIAVVACLPNGNETTKIEY